MSGFRQLAAPPTVSSPLDGSRNPAIRCSRVDFPAPLGPSRPVTPWPMVIVMSLIATTLPYHRETLRNSIALMLCLPARLRGPPRLPIPASLRRLPSSLVAPPSLLAPQSRRRRAPSARSCHARLPVPDHQPGQGSGQEQEQHRAVEG